MMDGRKKMTRNAAEPGTFLYRKYENRMESGRLIKQVIGRYSTELMTVRCVTCEAPPLS